MTASKKRREENSLRKPQADPPRRTYDQYATERLTALVRALGLPEPAEHSVALAWRAAIGALAQRAIPDAAPWPCSISDDRTPIEFSLVLDADAPELRLLWEPQGTSHDAAARHRAAQETLARLEGLPGVSISRFREIEPLFLPTGLPGGQTDLDFLAWHAARLWPGGPTEFKVYVNPAAAGPGNAAGLVQEAMQRLGLGTSWPSVHQALVRPGVDAIRYLSLDLREDGDARLKVYVYHPDATADLVQAVANTSPAADGQRVRSFFEAVTAGRAPAAEFCPGSCLSFVKGNGPTPVGVTLHVPVRGYVRSDAEVSERVASLTRAPEGSDHPFLTQRDAHLHRRAVAAISSRELHEGVGLTSYLSLRSQGTCERVTAYLATELFATEPPRS